MFTPAHPRTSRAFQSGPPQDGFPRAAFPPTKMKHFRSGLSAVAFVGLAFGARSFAQTTVNFDSGYSAGSTVIGVDDPSLPGTATWSNLFTSSSFTTASSTLPRSGSLGMQIDTSGTGTGAGNATGARIDMAGAGVAFADPTKPIRFSFSMNIESMSAGTGSQLTVSFGAGDLSVIGNNGAAVTTNYSTKYWWGLVVQDTGAGGVMNFYKSSASGNSGQVTNIGSYTSFADLGTYLTFDIVIDPVAKTFTSLTLTGSVGGNLQSTAISSIAGTTVPWSFGTLNTSNPGADPLQFFRAQVGGNDLVKVHFDDIAVANVSSIPEPASAALLFALAASAPALSARRRRRV